MTEIISAVVASGAGYLAANLVHRFFSTKDGGGAREIASPPSLWSAGAQAALAVGAFVAPKYAKIHQPHAKSALQGFGIGAGAHLLGQGIEYVLVRFLKNNSLVSRLFPQEIAAQTGLGALGGHPPLVEELHTMFPAMPKHLLHSFGVGYGPSYSGGGSYSEPQQPQLGHQHHGLAAPPPPPPGHPAHGMPPPPPPPPGAPVTPYAPAPPPGGHEHHGHHGHHGGLQLSAPCPTPDMRRSNLQEMIHTAQRELGQQCESLGLGRLPYQMNPDVDARDRN